MSDQEPKQAQEFMDFTHSHERPYLMVKNTICRQCYEAGRVAEREAPMRSGRAEVKHA